jgi:hypothetical protein
VAQQVILGDRIKHEVEKQMVVCPVGLGPFGKPSFAEVFPQPVVYFFFESVPKRRSVTKRILFGKSLSDLKCIEGERSRFAIIKCYGVCRNEKSVFTYLAGLDRGVCKGTRINIKKAFIRTDDSPSVTGTATTSVPFSRSDGWLIPSTLLSRNRNGKIKSCIKRFAIVRNRLEGTVIESGCTK